MFDCWAGQVVFIFALKWIGCGTVVRTFTSDSRGLSFESGRWLFLNKTCQQADIYWDGPSVPFRACFLDEKAAKNSLVI